MSSGAASRAGVRDTGRREGAAGNTAGAGSVRQSSHISRDVCLQASPLGGGAVPGDAGTSRQDVAAGNTAGNSPVRNASVDPCYADGPVASLPRSWEQDSINDGHTAKLVQGFITDAEANRASAIQIVSNGKADPRRTQLRAKGNEVCDEDTEKPSGGWYRGHASKP